MYPQSLLGSTYYSYGQNDDEEHEDDYNVVSLAVKDVIVALDPDERAKTVRATFSAKSRLYAERCSSVMGTAPKSNEYIQLICHFLPVKQIMIGQSPYASDILPRYSAAFSFDRKRAGFWTPTSQVLAQCMNKYEDVPVRLALDMISHSYLLVCRGLVLLNVYPYQGLNDQQQAKRTAS